MTRARQGTERGFTLIELMIGMVLTALVVGLGVQVSVTITQGFRGLRAAQDAERGARAGIDLLADAVRSASSSVQTGDLRDAAYCTVTAAIGTDNRTNGPDAITVLYSSGGVMTSLRSVFTGTSTTFDVMEASGLIVGDMVIISNGDIGRMVVIRDISATSGPATITTTAPASACPNVAMPTGGFPVGSLILRGKVARFYVASAADGTPYLWMDPDGDGPAAGQPLAEGIEDLQIAVGVDLDADGVIRNDGTATDEWFNAVAGDGAPPDASVSRWGAVRISLVARTLAADGPALESAPPALEDHPAGTIDIHRRRVLSTSVEIRNLELNP